MDKTKYIGMDVHKEHADFPIMPILGKSLPQLPALTGDFPPSGYKLHSA